MRGGNRQVAMIALEGLGLAFLAVLAITATPFARRPSAQGWLLAFLLLSPVWLALLYLLPVPQAVWSSTPGREIYPSLLSGAGIPLRDWLPLSLLPDATSVSLFAGIPIVAAFIGGFWCTLPQLRLLLKVVAGMAFAELLMHFLQLGTGNSSPLYFGGNPGQAYGTFANQNHFANFLALGLAAYIWVAWMALAQSRSLRYMHPSARARRIAAWIAGGVLLLLGIVMSRSRGAALAGLPAALLAFMVALNVGSRTRAWRASLLAALGALLVAVGLVGFQFIVSRFNLHALGTDASFRLQLSKTTLDGALQFLPWGAGWGTYRFVYPRFQPPAINGAALFAHDDYAQLLFEGGIFAVLLVAAFAVLALKRAATLVRAARQQKRLRREEMAAAICGLGLLGFLVHCTVEFNMHIPANAIVAALLAGVYLRPLAPPSREAADD
jgi:hypothetical protein